MRTRDVLFGLAVTTMACDPGRPVAIDAAGIQSVVLSSSSARAIDVAAPTGDPATDVAAIRAAVAAATAGSVVRFAGGTYALGLNTDHIVVTEPGVALVGHADGTTLKGSEVLDWTVPVVFYLTGGRQTVRGLHFSKVGEAIRVGLDVNPDRGGYVIEDCSFTTSVNPLWLGLQSREVTRIAHNVFVNTAIPSWTDGMTVHFVGNTMLTTDPSIIPLFGQPLMTDLIESWAGFPLAENNLVADNHAVGFPDGTHLASHHNGVTRFNTVRNNIYRAQRAYSAGDLGTMVVVQGWNATSTTDMNVIEGNALLGSEGIGVYIWGSTRTKVLRNTIHNVTDNVPSGIPGMGILVTATAPGQQIVQNDFAGNALVDVQLRSNDNLVVLREADDVVSDLGLNNRIVGGGVPAHAEAATREPGASLSSIKLEVLTRGRRGGLH